MADSDQHPRGVFSPLYDAPGGEELLVAIDGDGRQVAEAIVYEGVDRKEIVLALRKIIDATTPPTPPLYVVEDDESGVRQLTEEEV